MQNYSSFQKTQHIRHTRAHNSFRSLSLPSINHSRLIRLKDKELHTRTPDPSTLTPPAPTPQVGVCSGRQLIRRRQLIKLDELPPLQRGSLFPLPPLLLLSRRVLLQKSFHPLSYSSIIRTSLLVNTKILNLFCLGVDLKGVFVCSDHHSVTMISLHTPSQHTSL